VDNRFDLDRTPTQYQYYDFYQYGGIIRTVTLHEVPAVFIHRVELSPLTATGCAAPCAPSGRVSAKIVLGGAQDWPEGKALAFSYAFDGSKDFTPFDGTADAHGIITHVLDSTVFEKGQFWSPAKPNLHTVFIKLLEARTVVAHSDGVNDSIEARFGVRTVGTRGRAITVNGQPIKLKGFNRHDMYPQLGPSLPRKTYEADLTVLRKTGANFIRGCHYPQVGNYSPPPPCLILLRVRYTYSLHLTSFVVSLSLSL
jgi:beta-glucuronidase